MHVMDMCSGKDHHSLPSDKGEMFLTMGPMYYHVVCCKFDVVGSQVVDSCPKD